MSDILNAVNSIKPLIQAFEGLRLLTPVLEKLGSLEQAEKELTAIKQAEQIKCEEAKEELRKTNVDLTSAKTYLKDITKKIKDFSEEKIRTTDEICAKKVADTEQQCNDKIANAKDLVNNMLLVIEASKIQASEVLTSLNVEVEDKQKLLNTIRETISKLAGG